jgi:hypothetical protein
MRRILQLVTALGIVLFVINLMQPEFPVNGWTIAVLVFGPTILYVAVNVFLDAPSIRRAAQRDSYAKNDWRAKV